MVDNQHQQISGYRDLAQEDINAINAVKEAETTIGGLWRWIKEIPDVDQRQIERARDHLEDGFSALVRSIAKPEARF